MSVERKSYRLYWSTELIIHSELTVYAMDNHAAMDFEFGWH